MEWIALDVLSCCARAIYDAILSVKEHIGTLAKRRAELRKWHGYPGIYIYIITLHLHPGGFQFHT